MYDTLFYWAHRMMHIKIFYTWFHHVHHRSMISNALAQHFFHPVDYLITVLAALSPPLLVSNHIITAVVWNVVLVLESTNAHCGFRIPFAPDARAHDFHHSEPGCPANFGAFFLLWDKIMGTDKPYNDWLRRQELRAKEKKK
eukprot:TRINITY_DN2925_c0_g2_i7.p1 TRINITY_DN2925_c0_g2~~TRINITY_DN2925_c0_g2_i7.p1  ORF type:complete len:142 (-),score=15.07 TRINITY_DN2925_c0_g2_i7:135-560(-)